MRTTREPEYPYQTDCPLPQDQRQVNPVRGEVRVQVRGGGVNRKRLLRDQGGAGLVGEQDVGNGHERFASDR